jgi:hypothetical protein
VIKSRAITRLNRKADSPNSNANKNLAERGGLQPVLLRRRRESGSVGMPLVFNAASRLEAIARVQAGSNDPQIVRN